MNRLKISGIVIVLLVLTGVILQRGFTFLPAQASSIRACAWTLVPSQNPSTSTNVNASAAVTSKNVWMVGSFVNHGNSGPFLQTLTENWNGIAWKVVTSPNPGAGYNALLAVSNAPGGKLWAVGYLSNTTNGPRVDQTLIEYWNDKTWQVVPSPNVGPNNNDLYGVVAISSTDAWAVGSYVSTEPFNPRRVLIEHWDGKTWSVVTGANPSSIDGNLYAVTAFSSTNIWAVGTQSAGNSSATLVEHWDGTQWSAVTSPNPASVSNILYSISLVSPTSIWAVGTSENSASPIQTLTEHWDGTQWSVVSSPNPGSSVDAWLASSLSATRMSGQWGTMWRETNRGTRSSFIGEELYGK